MAERNLTANFVADTSCFNPAVDELVQKLKSLNQDFEQNKAKVNELNAEMREYQRELQKNKAKIGELNSSVQDYRTEFQQLVYQTNNGADATAEQQKRMNDLRSSIGNPHFLF